MYIPFYIFHLSILHFYHSILLKNNHCMHSSTTKVQVYMSMYTLLYYLYFTTIIFSYVFSYLCNSYIIIFIQQPLYFYWHI